ncbi:hypothetical protein V6N13_071825 [Hibiscus sabdariffa]
MSFGIATEKFKEVPKLDCIGSDRKFHELVVLRGCLSVVSFGDEIEELEIWIRKEYWGKEFSIGIYIPKTLQANDGLNNSSFFLPRKFMRVLCMMRSGEILFKYRNKAVVCMILIPGHFGIFVLHLKGFRDVSGQSFMLQASIGLILLSIPKG